MANPEHVEVMKRGKEAIAAWRRKHLVEGMDLSGADLGGVDLGGADLSGATLKDSDLTETKFRGSSVNGTDFDGAAFGLTVFADCDLSEARNLDKVGHIFPSTIGNDTIVKSGGKIPEAFLRGAGVPEESIRAIPGLVGSIEHDSCFIGYGEPDRQFAEQLNRDLTSKKISCWTYSMDNTPGEHTQREIREKRQGADKFVVLCSAEGLLKDGVLKEIEDQMDEDREKIIPISLDKVWKADGYPVRRGSRNLKDFLLERNYANFEEGADYERELRRLLKALERERA